jgi:hypothetical protein
VVLGGVGWLGKEEGAIQCHNKYYIVCLLFLFLASTNIVLDLNFHFVLMFLQAWVFSNVLFAKSHFFVPSFVSCQIHFGKFFFFFFGTMAIVLVKEAWLVVMMNDLDFGVRNVVFQAKVLNRYGTFDWIANKNMFSYKK